MIARPFLALLISLVILGVQPVFSQEENVNDEEKAERLMEVLRQEALLVEIIALVRSETEEILWSTDIREITVFGKQVQIRINSQNITVAADFTPYTQDKGQVMLLAQGQTWVRSNDSEQVRYQSALRSMPIDLGYPVLFYPLGVDLSDPGVGKTTLELQVTVYSLAAFLGSQDEPASDGGDSREGQTTASDD